MRPGVRAVVVPILMDVLAGLGAAGGTWGQIFPGLVVAWNESLIQEEVPKAQLFGPDLTPLALPFDISDEASRALAFGALDAVGTPDGFGIAWQSMSPFPGDNVGMAWLRSIEAGVADTAAL